MGTTGRFKVAGRRPEINRRESVPGAAPIVELQCDLEEYRRSQPRRTRMLRNPGDGDHGSKPMAINLPK